MKPGIKIILLLLTLLVGTTFLCAKNTLLPEYQLEILTKPLTDNRLNNRIKPEHHSYLLEDTITTVKRDTIKVVELPKEEFKIPNRLAKTQINFRINSSVSYLNFNHFKKNEAKKMFFQAWLKEKELQRLNNETDSLRKTYAIASSEKKEEIAAMILRAEEKSINLGQEIPVLYEAAREQEDLYWKSSASEEIIAFQEKIILYQDSIRQITEMQSLPKATVSDTIVFYKSAPKTDEIIAEVTGGVFYKIQIGAYKGKIPESANKLIKKLSLIRKVENYVDDKGVKIYTTGNLRVYNEAVIMQNQVKQEGIKNAIIAAYQNGKRITVAEARKLNNEL